MPSPAPPVVPRRWVVGRDPSSTLYGRLRYWWYATHRRRHLDRALTAHPWSLAGRVLDVGGNRTVRHGRFVGRADDRAWYYLNLEPAKGAHVVADAAALPIAAGAADTVLLVEVLEHVARPEAVLAEAARVLAPGGTLLVTVPFLVAVHGDPADYRRWTASGLAALLARVGDLGEVCIEAQGTYLAVLADLLRAGVHHLGRPLRWLGLVAFPLIDALTCAERLEVVRRHPFLASYTTGYLVTARRLGPGSGDGG